MLWLLVIGTAVSVVYKVAEMEKRSGLLWGALTLGICLGCAFTLPWPFLNLFIGFILSLGAMFTVNIVRGPR